MQVLSFIGTDNDILKLCSKKEQKLYRFFNYILLSLIVVVGFSSYYIIDIIFDNTFVSILLGAFWAFIFFNLYRFILFTVTGKKGKSLMEKIGLIFPNLFKISIITFFAIFISLPIELFINEGFIEENLPNVLSEKVQVVKLEIDSVYLTKEKELNKRIFFYQKQLDDLQSDIVTQKEKLKKKEYKIAENQIRNNILNLQSDLKLKQQKFLPIINEKKKIIANLNKEKQKELAQYKGIINNSNLIIERFGLLFKEKPTSEFFLTLFTIILFLSPLIYKLLAIYYPTLKYEKFHQEKMRQEVLYNYENFKQSYKEITYSILGNKQRFLELYIDAPFNTIKKVDPRKKEKKGSFTSFLTNLHQE